MARKKTAEEELGDETKKSPKSSGKIKETREVKEHAKEPSKTKHALLQPEINIGLVGHVDHGKTTLTERLSGRWTDTHSEEIKRGITIRLGYANFSVYYDETTKTYAAQKTETNQLIRTISLVDAPGHESLMATMLASATIIDGALLLVAANEHCPQPQTREHLMALEIVGIKKVIIVQNKIDLVTKEQALKNYEEIKTFLKGTAFENAPIIPLSAQHNSNIDLLLKTIQDYIPTPKRDPAAEPIMYVARSFDINKPGTKIAELKGGVLGGCVMSGKFKVGDNIEIKPGYEVEEKNQKVYYPLRSKIISLMTDKTPVAEVFPGGSIAVLTELDPSIVKSDKLTGSIVGLQGTLPETKTEIVLEVTLLNRVVGAEDDVVVEPLRKLEPIMLNVNSATTVGVITELSKNTIKCKLKLPVCCKVGSRMTLSRRIGSRFRLIGYGILKK